MRKICIDARMLFSSGIGTYIRNVLIGLQKQTEFQISVILPKKWAKEEAVFPFDKIFCEAPIYSIQEQILLPFLVPKCDLFWSPHFNIPIGKIKAKKRVVTLCDMYFAVHTENLSFLKKIYAKLFYQKAVDFSEKVITISSFSKKEILDHVKRAENKVTVIPLGVDTKLFSLKKKRQERKLPSKFFLYVGNVKPNKNLPRLFRAFSKLALENPSLSLVVVSKAKEEEKKQVLQKAFKEKVPSSILFFNDVLEKELPYFYEKAISFVFPSLYEGFGLPPLEAMSLGCPVLTSSIEPLLEVCGSSAFYFDPCKEEEIYKGMKQVLVQKEEVEKKIKEGKMHVKKFSWETVAKRHLSLFKEILNR